MGRKVGHSTISITLDTYSHAIPALQEAAAALIAGWCSLTHRLRQGFGQGIQAIVAAPSTICFQHPAVTARSYLLDDGEGDGEGLGEAVS